MTHKCELGTYHKAVVKGFQENQKNDLLNRLWAHDHTLWKPEPTEISNRLGWLHSTEHMPTAIPEIRKVVDELRREGFNHALLLGMGGSSLAPEVFRYTFGIEPGYLDLSVLDSTDPGAISACENKLKDTKTIYIVSTKSGGTVETLSFMKYFYTALCERVGRQAAGSCFIAITDPGSGLEKKARHLNFRKIFLNDPNIGGRFSALSYFGLVAAALIGVKIDKLLDRANQMVVQSKNREGENSPLWLGTAMGVLAEQGRDKLTLILSPRLKSLGAWIEQLIAESSGKEGRGILPVDGEALLSPDAYAEDRLFVSIHIKGEQTNQKWLRALVLSGQPLISLALDDRYDLGGEYFRWEIAISIACTYLKVNPFDQPNVEAAKIVAREMMTAYKQDGNLPQQKAAFEENGCKIFSTEAITKSEDILSVLLKKIKKGAFGTYLAIQAYLQPTDKNQQLLQELRTAIQKRYRIATTVGFGPRYLHSTGQLHKGGRPNGLFLQIIDRTQQHVAIPDEAGDSKSSFSFNILKSAQAWGDREALIKEGRRVVMIDLGYDVTSGIKKLLKGLI